MKKAWTSNYLRILLSIFFAFAVILPLFSMLMNLGGINIAEAVSSPQFLTAIKNSLISTTISTFFTIVLAFLLAWCLTRSNIKFKAVWSVLFTLPMLIPSISHGMGLVLLFGRNGILTNFFGMNGSIYGLGGIVTGSVMYAFPAAFLMFVDVLKYEDYSSYEAADLLGIPKRHQFLSISLPYLRKPLISIIFATFALIVTDYGVPLMVGGKFLTLPVMMYQEVIGLLNFGTGSLIGMLLLLPAVVAFIFDMFNRDKGNLSYSIQAFSVRTNKLRNFFCYALCGATGLFVVFPVAAFGLLTFVKKYPIDLTVSIDNVLKALNMNAGRYLINSLIIAIVVSITGTVFSYLTAYLTARTKGKHSKLLHLISITSLAVPGVVLGLSYVLFFKGSFLYGTLAMLIIVNIIHFFASPYLMAYNSFNKLNENLEAVGSTLGISRYYLVKDVLIPQMRHTILEMFAYFFVNSMITISAVSFLSSINTMPVALLIPQFESQMLLECSACVSIIILACNIVLKLIVYFARRSIIRREEI